MSSSTSCNSPPGFKPKFSINDDQVRAVFQEPDSESETKNVNNDLEENVFDEPVETQNQIENPPIVSENKDLQGQESKDETVIDVLEKEVEDILNHEQVINKVRI